jgi:hypothetical protein
MAINIMSDWAPEDINTRFGLGRGAPLVKPRSTRPRNWLEKFDGLPSDEQEALRMRAAEAGMTVIEFLEQ